jgi:membrane-bound metal-dependent hydrolase YbcI (DUF457 family)
MLVGHVAISLLGKRAAPQVSLGTLTLASMLPDLLGFVFVLAGLEHWRAIPGGRGIESRELYDIGLSHSLATDALWAALFAAVYHWRKRYGAGALMLFAAVLSHWVLDFISHRPDMPLAPGIAQVYGLGLWTSLPWTLAVEGGLWLASLIVYVRMTRAKNGASVIIFWLGVALLTMAWIPNFADSAPPPSVQSPIFGSIVPLVFLCLIVAWAFWMNRLRPRRGVSFGSR